MVEKFSHLFTLNNDSTSSNILLCTMDEVDFYHNNLDDEGLSALTKTLDKR